MSDRDQASGPPPPGAVQAWLDELPSCPVSSDVQAGGLALGQRGQQPPGRTNEPSGSAEAGHVGHSGVLVDAERDEQPAEA